MLLLGIISFQVQDITFIFVKAHIMAELRKVLPGPHSRKKQNKNKPTKALFLFSLILLHDCPQKALVVSQASSIFLDQKSWGIRSWILFNLSISMIFPIVCFYEFIIVNIVEELALGRQIVSLWSRKSGNCYRRKQVCGEMHFSFLFVLS